MRIAGAEFFAPTLVAIGLLGAALCFVAEARSFRSAIRGWAERDLGPRTTLAAETLEEPLATGDFSRVREFGNSCTADGVRLTVFCGPRGLVFDSADVGDRFPEAIYVSRACGEYTVRLGLPLERVFAPFRRARLGFVLAALVGGSGVLLVFLFTYRQRMRFQEMQKAEAFRRDFIADVSHEIKTPLTGILGAVDLLADGENLPSEGRATLLAMIKRESVRLNDLVQGILSLARLERADELAVKGEATDLAQVVGEAVERLRPRAEAQGVVLTADLAAITATCDGQLIGMAVTNLIVNALVHSGSKTVTVSLTRAGTCARVVVEDRGVGIPPEARGRIFERFYRVDASRAAATGGTGLGLAIVRQVARLHGGDAVLEPVTPSGCRFVVTIVV